MRAFDYFVLVWLAVLTIPFSVRVSRWIATWSVTRIAPKAICDTCGNVGFMIVDNKSIPCPDCDLGKTHGRL